MKEGTADVVEIYNNAMQLVKSENMVNAKVAIDVTGLSSGMYFVKVNNTISKLNLN
jgi:hypothetical protein